MLMIFDQYKQTKKNIKLFCQQFVVNWERAFEHAFLKAKIVLLEFFW